MDEPRILDSISSPADLKVLTNEELKILADEIRAQIISTTSHTGGHVASSLGAVEIILAAHSLLNAPTDKLIFDVGHQAYAHKLITGRVDRFDTLRTYGGISGFPRPSESPYDVHPSGHASDSLSVATGLAKARLLKGTDEKVVAIIGDAAIAGGMAFEALNYMGTEQLPLVIILNDNEMSISRNVGALMRHLGDIRATSQYRDAREALQERMESGGIITNAVLNFGKNVKESMKQFAIPHSMIFEQLGIVCTAPIDGHDVGALKETLGMLLAMDAPALMHVVTRKGAGFDPAMSDPERFHGVGPYDPVTGEDKGKGSTTAPAAVDGAATDSIPTYTEVFGDALVREAAADEDIVAITAAMASGTGLKGFAATYPDRFVDVGIAETQAVGMASGLAIGGKKPVVAIYSTFLQRAFDQIVIDCALASMNVVFALDRAGIVGGDGPTHNGVYDIAYLRMIPNMRVLAPSDEAELVNALHTALALEGPVAVRYPRGKGEGVPLPAQPETLEAGKSRVAYESAALMDDAALAGASAEGATAGESAVPEVTLLAFGRMVKPAVEAARMAEADGKTVRVVDMCWVKPLDRDAIAQAARSQRIVTIEEGVISGGVGEGVLQVLSDMGSTTPTTVLGIPDRFVMQGDTETLLRTLGLDAQGIYESLSR